MWCRGVVIKRADSQRRGGGFESCTCHNENMIGEEGNGTAPHLTLAYLMWCRGVMIKRADSQRRGGGFESCTCHNENMIGEEGNGTAPHRIHFPRKTQSHVSGFCYARN